VVKIFQFAIKKRSQATWSTKHLPHSEKESYEIAKIFGGFEQIFSFFSFEIIILC